MRHRHNAFFHAALKFGGLHKARHICDIARLVHKAFYAVSASGFAYCDIYVGMVFGVVVGESFGNRADGCRSVNYYFVLRHGGLQSQSNRRGGC